jgi:hypothetical protein
MDPVTQACGVQSSSQRHLHLRVPRLLTAHPLSGLRRGLQRLHDNSLAGSSHVDAAGCEDFAIMSEARPMSAPGCLALDDPSLDHRVRLLRRG